MNVTGIILAAGLGTRLRPSTDLCPKPLIPVGGVEPLFFALLQFHRAGVKRVVVNAHYLHERIQEALDLWQPLFPGIECRVSVEQPEILGTGGAILKILRDHADWFQGVGLLLQNGDTLANIPLRELTARPDQSSFGISSDPGHLEKYKPLWIDAAGNWVGIGAAPPSAAAVPAHFLGVHYLSPAAIGALYRARLPVKPVDLFNGLYRPLADQGFAFASHEFLLDPRSEDFWFDMNTPEYLLEAQKYVLETLPVSGVWRDVLKARYPAIREVARGVWVVSRGQASINHVYRAPAVLIEGLGAAGESLAAPLTLGPHASFVYERGRLAQSPGAEIRNAVVMVNSAVPGALPQNIQNEIRVL